MSSLVITTSGTSALLTRINKSGIQHTSAVTGLRRASSDTYSPSWVRRGATSDNCACFCDCNCQCTQGQLRVSSEDRPLVLV
jgi:hypothetical protein